MIQAAELQEKLWALNDNKLSLDQFERWIGPASVNLHIGGAPDVMEKVSEIHHLFSDYGDGHIDDARLRRELLSLLDNVVVCLRIDMNLELSNEKIQRFGSGEKLTKAVLSIRRSGNVGHGPPKRSLSPAHSDAPQLHQLPLGFTSALLQ